MRVRRQGGYPGTAGEARLHPDLEPRFLSGPPGEFDGYQMVDGEPVPGKLRNWVCELDGVIIDGHQGNYPEYVESDCILCGKDLMTAVLPTPP